MSTLRNRVIKFGSHSFLSEDADKYDIKYVMNGEQHQEEVEVPKGSPQPNAVDFAKKKEEDEPGRNKVVVTNIKKCDDNKDNSTNEEYKAKVDVKVGSNVLRGEEISGLSPNDAIKTYKDGMLGEDENGDKVDVQILNIKEIKDDEDEKKESFKIKTSKYVLDESLFDDFADEETVVDSPKGETVLTVNVADEEETPAPGADTGIAALLIKAINDEWATIDEYNSIIATMSEEGKGEMVPVIQDIVAEENVHVGQLQTLLQTISPNVAKVAEGEAEAAEQLAGVDNE